MDSNLIRILVLDVDGTLTDGKIYMGSEGEFIKTFDIKDGLGIHDILPQYGIVPVIITGRTSAIVERRAKEIGIAHIYQGVRNKADILRKISQQLKVPMDHIACIGDDINDMSMLELCGVKGCPADAVKEVKRVADYICRCPGGQGAVREFIEWLIQRD